MDISLQVAGCPACHPTNGVNALKAQPYKNVCEKAVVNKIPKIKIRKKNQQKITNY